METASGDALNGRPRFLKWKEWKEGRSFRATSDLKKRAERVLGGGTEFGETTPPPVRPPPVLAGHKTAARLSLASTHPAKCLWPFAGTPGDLGLKKTRFARF